VTALGVALRSAHLAGSIAVLGAYLALLVAGPSRWPTARSWERTVVAGARLVLLALIPVGLALLAQQAAVAEGRAAAAFEPRAWLAVLLDTHAGRVWALRHGLLVVLAALAFLAGDAGRRADLVAVRGEGALLAAVALAALAAAGHAVAAEPAPLPVVADAVHLLAAGVWVGAMPWLARLLWVAASERAADARPYAVVAARRFSRLALGGVLVLSATGLANAGFHVGGVPALIGTPYGRWLGLKLALFAALLAVAAVNRRRLLPALGGDGPRVGRPAMRRLAAGMGVEALLALGVLVVVTIMAVTPPARHEAPAWPLRFRLDLGLALEPAVRSRALAGSQLVVVGLVALASAAVVGRRFLAAGGLGLIATGLAVALPSLAVEAYPTTYRRPDVPYTVTSIVQGGARYREHCARCHGPAGAGDGPDSGRGPRAPADLRRLARPTAGDLFWRITHGRPAAGMPAFGDRLAEEERWDLVNYVRALAFADQARRLGPGVERDGPRLIAPDFVFSVGPMTGRSLRDYRGRRHVLLVLYTLPASRPRLERLAGGYALLDALGAEVIAVPREGAPDAIRRLGARPPIFFPVVTDGAADIVQAYRLFGDAPHVEFLVDRLGYLRARWTATGAREGDLDWLVADLRRLAAEPAAVPPAEAHVH
jgi:putative copper resistance protein D